MKTRTTAAGLVLIVIALVLGAVQDLHIYNIYGSVAGKWYFYGAIGVILLAGVALAAWGLLKKKIPKQTNP